jgi:hypothetical protein
MQSLVQARFAAGGVLLVDHPFLSCPVKSTGGKLGDFRRFVPPTVADKPIGSLDVGSSSRPIDSIT